MTLTTTDKEQHNVTRSLFLSLQQHTHSASELAVSQTTDYLS